MLLSSWLGLPVSETLNVEYRVVPINMKKKLSLAAWFTSQPSESIYVSLGGH